MQLFRHYLASDAEYREIMIDNLRNFGFVMNDGKEIPPVEVWEDPNNTEIHPSPKSLGGFQTSVALCWKYEKLNQLRYILQRVNNYREDCAWNIKSSLGYYLDIAYPSINSQLIYARIFDGVSNIVLPGRLFFFIPLKNNGFLLQQSTNRLSQVETYTSTGKFYTLKDTYNFNNDYIYDQAVVSGIICINPNISNLSLSNFLYIPYGYTYEPSILPSRRIKNFQLYKPRIIIENQDIPITGLDIDQKYYDNYNINVASPTEPNYFIDYSIHNRFTNVAKNTCVLIKTPYQNEFIDNMYLFSTMPEEDMEGKFFSFNGRNFLCVFKNFVVELAN